MWAAQPIKGACEQGKRPALLPSPPAQSRHPQSRNYQPAGS